MTDAITSLNDRSHSYAILRSHVHVQNGPAGLFQPVAIQVKDHLAIFRAGDHAIGNGNLPGV